MIEIKILGKSYQGNNKVFLIIIGVIDSLLFELLFPFHFYKYTRNKKLITNPRKILLIRLDNIGDVILITPLIKNLKKLFPNAKIDVLVKNSTAPILKKNPYINKIFRLTPPWFARRKENSYDLKKTWGVIKNLRKEEYDLGFELRGQINNLALLALIAPKFKIGYSLKGGSFILDLSCYPNQIHEVDKNNYLLESFLRKIKVKIPRLEREPEVFVGKTDIKKTQKIFEKNRFNIVIHCSSAWSYRNYPPKLFAKVINKLVRRKKDSFFSLLTNKSEQKTAKEILEHLEEKSKKNTKIINNLSISQLIAFLSECDLFIGNDSGPAHISAALGKKTIVLFGPQDPKRFGPIGKNVRIIYKKVPCSPCRQEKMKDGCPFHRKTCLGLLKIRPEEIINESFQ